MTRRREMAVVVALGLAATSARAQGADPPPSLSELEPPPARHELQVLADTERMNTELGVPVGR